MNAPSPPPAGWYEDPEDAGAQRYWDGGAWSQHRARKPLTPPVGPSEPYASPDQSTASSTPFTEGRRRPRNGLLIGAGLAVLALVVAGMVVVTHVVSKTSTHPDVDRIRAVVKAQETAYNAVDYNAWLWTICAAYRPQMVSQLDWVNSDKSSIGGLGPIEFTPSNVTVTGDTATAVVSSKGQREPESKRTTDTWQFVREGGSWLDCSPALLANAHD